MKLLITGGSGLIGSRITELLHQDFEIVNGDRASHQNREIKNIFLDITDKNRVQEVFAEEKPDIVLHLAAIADLELCEKDHSLATKVNVEGTRNLVIESKSHNSHFIFMSTGFVFKGDRGNYKEVDKPEPQNFYAETKYQAEEIVKNSGCKYSIIRINYPYRAIYPPKTDCVRWMIPKLQNKEEITVVSDQFLKPIFIDKIAEGIRLIIKNKKQGVFHFADTSYVNWVDLAREVAEVFRLDKNLVKGITYSKYIEKTKRTRGPLDVSLNTEKTEKELELKMLSLKQGLEEIKKQTKENNSEVKS